MRLLTAGESHGQALVVVLDHLGPVQRAAAQLDRDDLAREHGPERRRGIEPLLSVPGPAKRGGVLEQGHGGGREGDEECDGGADPGHGASPRASEPRNRRRMRSPKGTSLRRMVLKVVARCTPRDSHMRSTSTRYSSGSSGLGVAVAE